MAGRKSFKQFYYDWHIDAMIEPFAELADYFNRRYPIDTAAHFDRFVRDFATASIRIILTAKSFVRSNPVFAIKTKNFRT